MPRKRKSSVIDSDWEAGLKEKGREKSLVPAKGRNSAVSRRRFTRRKKGEERRRKLKCASPKPSLKRREKGTAYITPQVRKRFFSIREGRSTPRRGEEE